MLDMMFKSKDTATVFIVIISAIHDYLLIYVEGLRGLHHHLYNLNMSTFLTLVIPWARIATSFYAVAEASTLINTDT